MSNGAEMSAFVLVHEPHRVRRITEALATQGFVVVGDARDATDARSLIEERQPALLVVELDSLAGGENGNARNEGVFELVRAAREHLPTLNVVAVMESVDPGLIETTAEGGVDAYVVVPD
jgi:AmiR/NasT family two-component response regulator